MAPNVNEVNCYFQLGMLPICTPERVPIQRKRNKSAIIPNQPPDVSSVVFD